MRFGVLGPVEVWDRDQRLAVGGPQQRELLAVLLLDANRVVSVDRLVEQLWGERPPATARSLLRGCVAGLRRVLRDAEPGDQRLQTVAPGYRLRVAPGELDLDRFEQLVRDAESEPDPKLAAGLLAEALELWRGPVLDGVRPDRYQAQMARLEERRLAVLQRRIELDLLLGRNAAIVGELQVLVEAHPLRERLSAQLMRALYDADRRAEALNTFRQLRQNLVEQLGMEPSATVQELHRMILSEPAEPAATQPAAPAQLPAAPAAFTGRARHLKRIDELLSESDAGTRVVAISGMAGVGKTALAIHWGHRVRERFSDGQLYVNLRGYATPPMRPIEALAGFLQALGLPAERVPADLERAAGLYRSTLADRRVLIVLDNAHSVDQVRPLLPGGSASLVLVTSRQRLDGLVAIEGAAHVRLDVLNPDGAHDLLARLLGVERAQAEPGAVRELARLCGYLPLALRVAAAGVILHPHQRIADQVAKLASGDRLAALAVDQDDAATVQAAFDQSYVALAPPARSLFRLLGLVPGPHVTVDAAAALAGIAAEPAGRLLQRLASAHLLDQPATDTYTLHDLVRDYAANRAHAEDSADNRREALHRLLSWYMSAVDAAARLLYPEALRLPRTGDVATPVAKFASPTEALAWLERERPNLAAGLAYATEAGPRRLAYHLADALQGFYWLRIYPVEWLAVSQWGLAAARADGDQAAEAAAEYNLGNVHMVQSMHGPSIEHHRRGLALAEQCGWLELQCRTLNGIGVVQRRERQLAEAIHSLEEALARSRRCGWIAGQASSLGNLGLTYIDLGDLRRVVEHLSDALVLYRQLGSSGKEAFSLGILGTAYHVLGQLDHAEDHLTGSLDLARKVGDRRTIAEAQIHLAAVHRDAGRHRRALEVAEAALASAFEVEETTARAAALVMLGTVHHELGHHRRALETFDRALRLAREIEDREATVEVLIGTAAVEHDTGRWQDATATIRRAVELARNGRHRVQEGQSLTTLAAIDVTTGRLDDAVEHANQAIAIHRETGHRLGEARALRELGRALDRRGDADAASESRHAAYTIFREIGSPETDRR